MPGPSLIVTIVDAEGDEFPIRLWERYESVVQRRQAALNEVERLIQEGSFNPTFPVTVPEDRVQPLNGYVEEYAP